jgi:hypothetical protein
MTLMLLTCIISRADSKFQEFRCVMSESAFRVIIILSMPYAMSYNYYVLCYNVYSGNGWLKFLAVFKQNSVSWDSWVSNTIDYKLGSWGLIVAVAPVFLFASTMSALVLQSIQTLVHGVLGALSLRVKQPEYGADRWPPH